jgi:hypothetical protein
MPEQQFGDRPPIWLIAAIDTFGAYLNDQRYRLMTDDFTATTSARAVIATIADATLEVSKNLWDRHERPEQYR